MIKIILNNDELLIKGDKDGLQELSNYIIEMVNSNIQNHIHLDDLTIIDNNSSIKSLVIEKE